MGRKIKFFALIIMTIGLYGLFGSESFAFDWSTCEEKTFIVTAYYSPKPGQLFYYKKDLEAEKTLNGDGFVGASGKKVFNGMLAAPGSYDFGGKIYFPDMGVGEISDRGGAIVQAGKRGYEHDRIDIRMGEGEEGLVRALTFGKQTKKGYYCSVSTLKRLNVSTPVVGLDFSSIPFFKNFFDMSLFIQELYPERTDIWSYTLQKYLMKLGFMNKKTGYFGPETKKALCNYQVSRGISTWKYCGVFGKRTRAYMKQELKKKGLLPDDLYAHGTLDQLKEIAVNYSTPNPSFKIEKGSSSSKIEGAGEGNENYKGFTFYRPYKRGEQNGEIEILQGILRDQGFYTTQIDGKYSTVTIDALFQFQKYYSIVGDDDHYTLQGYLGPATRTKINELLRSGYTDLAQSEQVSNG